MPDPNVSSNYKMATEYVMEPKLGDVGFLDIGWRYYKGQPQSPIPYNQRWITFCAREQDFLNSYVDNPANDARAVYIIDKDAQTVQWKGASTVRNAPNLIAAIIHHLGTLSYTDYGIGDAILQTMRPGTESPADPTFATLAGFLGVIRDITTNPDHQPPEYVIPDPPIAVNITSHGPARHP